MSDKDSNAQDAECKNQEKIEDKIFKKTDYFYYFHGNQGDESEVSTNGKRQKNWQAVQKKWVAIFHEAIKQDWFSFH